VKYSINVCPAPSYNGPLTTYGMTVAHPVNDGPEIP